MKDDTPYVPAAEFKAKCLKIMERVAATGREVVVTKHGKPVARLVPAESSATAFVGRLRGTLGERGDLLEGTGETWDAEAD